MPEFACFFSEISEKNKFLMNVTVQRAKRVIHRISQPPSQLQPEEIGHIETGRCIDAVEGHRARTAVAR